MRKTENTKASCSNVSYRKLQERRVEGRCQLSQIEQVSISTSFCIKVSKCWDVSDSFHFPKYSFSIVHHLCWTPQTGISRICGLRIRDCRLAGGSQLRTARAPISVDAELVTRYRSRPNNIHVLTVVRWKYVQPLLGFQHANSASARKELFGHKALVPNGRPLAGTVPAKTNVDQPVMLVLKWITLCKPDAADVMRIESRYGPSFTNI